MRAEIGLQVRDVAAAAFAGAQLSAHRNEKNLLDSLPLATALAISPAVAFVDSNPSIRGMSDRMSAGAFASL